MFKTLTYNMTNVVVGKGVYIGFSLSSARYQLCVFKYPELMGYCRLFHRKKLRNCANTKLAFKKGIQNLYSGRIAEYLKKITQIAKQAVFRKPASDLQQGLAVVVLHSIEPPFI